MNCTQGHSTLQRMWLARTKWWFLALVVVGGCSSSGGDGASPEGGAVDGAQADGQPRSDGGVLRDAAPAEAGDADSGFVEAPHAALPQVPNDGGPVVASPRIVTITFAGYAQDATMKSFADWVVGSSWLAQVGHDYGVGQGVHVAHVVLQMTAPQTASDLDTQALIEQKIGDGTLPSPFDVDAGADGGVDAGSGVAGGYLYVLFYPQGTTATGFLGGPDTCADLGGGQYIGGYHWETQSGAYHVPYAVIPTCSDASGVEGAPDIEISASHEILEASTDPFPYTNTGYALTDPSNPWTYTDGEVADLCEGQTLQQAGFSVQRIWSNTAAAAGTTPCIPAPSEGFYDVSPSPNTTQTVAAGSSVTFTLTGFSTTPLPPWTLQAFAGYGTFVPTLDLSVSTIDNGQTATLKVTVPSTAGAQGYASVFVSSVRGPSDFNYWPVAVATP
jgi:hypothetical protein